MKINRLICLIISFIALFVLLMYSFIYPDRSFLFFFIMILFLLPANVLKQKEKKEKLKIIMNYSTTGNTSKFIDDMTMFNNKCIMSKSTKFFEEINIGIVHITAGEFQKVEELMIKLSKNLNKVNDSCLIYYYRLCCDYFFYKNKPEELNAVIENLEHIIKNASIKIQTMHANTFLLSESKKNILEEKNLESVKQMFLSMKFAPTPINLLSREYILSIIALKQKKYDEAIDKLKVLSEKNYNIFFVNNAKKLLNEVKNNN